VTKARAGAAKRPSAGPTSRGETGPETASTFYEQEGLAQALLGAIVASSDDAIISKTLDGVITSWNAGAEKIFGYTAAEAIGQSITMIVPEDRLDEEAEVLRRVRAGERIDHFETVRRGKDGRVLDVSVTVSPIFVSSVVLMLAATKPTSPGPSSLMAVACGAKQPISVTS